MGSGFGGAGGCACTCMVLTEAVLVLNPLERLLGKGSL